MGIGMTSLPGVSISELPGYLGSHCPFLNEWVMVIKLCEMRGCPGEIWFRDFLSSQGDESSSPGKRATLITLSMDALCLKAIRQPQQGYPLFPQPLDPLQLEPDRKHVSSEQSAY